MLEKHERPPCYLLGIETQIGLSLIRELGAAGVPVIGIATSADAIGLQSRFLARGEILHQPRTDAGLDELRALGERHGPGYLLTVSEANTAWLIANRHRLGTITALLPPEEAFAIVLDKERTLAAAAAVGIEVPGSISPTTWAEVEEVARSFRFPAVLKWADPNAIGPALRAAGLEVLKAEYAYNADDFLRLAERYRSFGRWPLMQEYCAGVGLGQFFFMHKGEAVRRFQHLRVAEWPPEGGFSSVCDAVPLTRFTELQEKSIGLLQYIGWEGVAMVEYRYDPETGRAVLMEINGRFWGSYPLAMQAGAGFGLLAYSLQGQGIMPRLPRIREHLRCRMVATEIKRLKRILLEPSLIRDRNFEAHPVREILRFIGDFLRPSVRYYVWTPHDIKPLIRDIRNALGI